MLTITGYGKNGSLPFFLWCRAIVLNFRIFAPQQARHAQGYSVNPSVLAMDLSM
jgi:hypothetical protein